MPCPEPGCPHLQPCAVHSATTTERGYGSRWQRRARSFLRRHPICEDCGGPSSEADHDPPRRVLLRMGVADPDADEHLHARCKRCHSVKTATEDRDALAGGV